MLNEAHIRAVVEQMAHEVTCVLFAGAIGKSVDALLRSAERDQRFHGRIRATLCERATKWHFGIGQRSYTNKPPCEKPIAL